MTFMADDCVFETAAGPDVVLADARHFVAGERGLSEWVLTGTSRDGKRVEVQGCDVFTFRGETIAVQRSFLKNRSA